MRLRENAGLTLLEVTVVIVLATLVMAGIVGFYLNSQAVWVDASTQAVTQREATLVLEDITQAARMAAGASVTQSPDTSHSALTLFSASGGQLASFRWDETDSTIVASDTSGAEAPIGLASVVERFQVVTNDTLVTVKDLTLRSPSGRRVTLASTVLLYNR